ncbi:MAG TPA: AAA family ATPase [Blastocatellia bacterium]|jgi:exonuclease SbcC|nr:AAA family ATPase [Blastocatellia bacterium]
MLITRVELENIKNYEEGSFEFEPGVTAISGPNGSGKTTIIEAISWALFDQLPYKKEDFLRRGAKKGVVRVTFVSALDGREYTVHRDTGAGYYIHDPVTKMRLVEQKQQVGAWLKQHLGVDAGTDLKTLFTSTIGVPQGTLTVDFADQPAKRKIGFDKVLRVDEYHRSSEDLRSLVRLVESREATVREEIARVEVEVAALDGLLAEKARYEDMIARARQELARAEFERDRSRDDLERLDNLRRSIERLTADSSSLALRIEESDRRLSEVAQGVKRSREAKEAVGRAAAGFATYNEANARLAELEPQAILRDALKKELTDKEREHYKLEAATQAQRDKVLQLEVNRAELEKLAPLVEEQERAEARRTELQTMLGELNELRRRESAAKTELDSLRAEYADISRQIDEAEKLKTTAGRVPALEDERRAIEEELRETRVQLERIRERRNDLKRVRENIAKLSGEVSTLEKEIAAGLEAERLVERLPELEGQDQAAMEEIANLRASIDREKKILNEIKGGMCPLLSQRCLNMKDGQGLDQYFKLQVGNERERLIVVERARKELQGTLAKAKAALRVSSAIAAQRVHLSRLSQEVEIERKNAARLEGETSGAAVNEQSARTLEQRLVRIEQELQEAQAARLKYEKLDILRGRMERLKVEGGEKRRAFEELKNRLESMGRLQDDLLRVEDRLRDLEDPRGRSRSLREGLKKEEEVRLTLAELEGRERELASSIRDLEKGLESFASLDQSMTFERERRAASEKDHRAYIESQPIAALLDEREKEMAAIDLELKNNREQLQLIDLTLRRAKSEYSEGEHARVKSLLEESINRVAALGSELNASTGRLEELKGEISNLMAARKRMAGLIREKERCEQLRSLSDFIRDLLRKAGPFITEAHLQSISMEANQLYRDITGNPMVSLRWDMGYEVILEEDGHERSFASLSGGEQMAAALAVRLALLKELSDLRIAFFDEPTTNMDEERRRNLAQQIGRIKDFDQLFVISHDDAFEGFTDRVVSVRAPGTGA